MASFPPSGGADQAISNNAEPEVHEQAHVELERPMARQGKGGREKEVGHVAEDDGEQSLNQIYEHRGFRHRGHGAWSLHESRSQETSRRLFATITGSV